MKKGFLFIFFLLVVLFAASSGYAVPIEINYQGYLTDQNSAPVNGVANMTFRLYDDPTAGTLQWNSGTVAVDVANGVYSIVLGETPQPAINPAIFANQLWLSVEVESDGEMAPRQKLTAISYAIQAGTAESVGWSNISGVPAGFSDNTDNDTTYSAGNGLNLAGTTFEVSMPLQLTEEIPGAMIRGENISDSGFGLAGYATSSTGSATGVYGESGSTVGTGVYGIASSPEGKNYGVWGISSSADGFGVYGSNSAGFAGYFDGDVGTTGTISGSGSGITNLNASYLTTGILPGGRLAGTYASAVNLTNASNTISGDGAGLTHVDADTLGGLKASDFTPASMPQIPRTNIINGLDNALAGQDLYSTATIGMDGLPIIAYNGGFGGSAGLKVAKCGDPACSLSQATITVVDSSGIGASMTIGSDGMPVIAYPGSGGLTVAKCEDGACQSSLKTSTGIGGALDTAISIGIDGFPIVAFTTSNELNVLKCNTADCSSFASSNVASGGSVRSYPSIAVSSDGLPVISDIVYVSEYGLEIYKCDDNACTSASLAVGVPALSGNASLTIGNDGLPVVSFYCRYVDPGLCAPDCPWTCSNGLAVIKCGSLDCDILSLKKGFADLPGTGQDSSISVGADGLPVISHFDGTNNVLKISKCIDKDCSDASSITVDNSGIAGKYSSITVAPDGFPVIAYYLEAVDEVIRVLKCANPFCLNGWSRR